MALRILSRFKGKRGPSKLRHRLRANITEKLFSSAGSFYRSIYAEILGTFIFQLIGGSTNNALINGLVLSVCIYITAKASGGVLNPGVATSLYAIGKLNGTHCLAYVLAQLVGAVLGARLGAILDVNDTYESWSWDSNGPGCVPHNGPEMYLKMFTWECVGMFILSSTVLATAIAKPGFGNIAPIAIGLSVTINISTSGNITGGAYSPARFFGPALAFGCRLNLIWLYFGAHVMGSLLAAASYCIMLDNYANEPDRTRTKSFLSEDEQEERKAPTNLEIVCPKDDEADLESPTDVMQSFSAQSLLTPMSTRSHLTPMSTKSQQFGSKAIPLSTRSMPISTRSLPRSTKNIDQHWAHWNSEAKLSPPQEHNSPKSENQAITPLGKFSASTLISRISAGLKENHELLTPLSRKSDSRPV
mmetsp:Transcript_32263/g.63896  ORF Transcript_32263/g.63896 Transcript_32263/m.63896 type:complete len:417 (-) Transcript_32263:276-1526(-)|eukprot:CAMPEP_0194329150 /NCGR_PEP_ID=MMETSP0171-20130528/47169_1 /TAXON_ID=218684 /ORGANISM="Corethron pennatum, Strain L29A3" /LENGTH=416 /DNA_ID=CAMNT_0039089781 /DNA_START=202 /DNA_END=1452 /DNA_ORIENTATION=-